MNNRIKVSVLVVTYNQERFIGETIKSIVNQKADFQFEVIVANDCSTDSTAIIIDEYVSNYPQIVKHLNRSKNLGLIGNLFDGMISHCRGSYIALCAGDDYWIDSKKLQKQVEYLDSNPMCSMVHTGFQKLFMDTGCVDNTTKWDSILSVQSGKEYIKSVLNEAFSFFPVASSMMFRGPETIEKLWKCKELYLKKGVPGEGIILFSVFTELGYFYFLSDVTTVYRVQGQSACHYEDTGRLSLFQLKYIVQKLDVASFYKLDIGFRVRQYLHAVVSSIYIVYNGNKELLLEFLELVKNNKYDIFLRGYLSYVFFMVKNTKLTNIIHKLLNKRKDHIQNAK